MPDRQTAADSVVRLLTLAERRGVISGAEHRYARDVIEALSVRLAQAEQERDQWKRKAEDRVKGATASLSQAKRETQAAWTAAYASVGDYEEAVVRLREYEEALTFYADHTNWGITNWADGKHVEFLTISEPPWTRAENALSAAASGGREAPDTKEPNV